MSYKGKYATRLRRPESSQMLKRPFRRDKSDFFKRVENEEPSRFRGGTKTFKDKSFRKSFESEYWEPQLEKEREKTFSKHYPDQRSRPSISSPKRIRHVHQEYQERVHSPRSFDRGSGERLSVIRYRSPSRWLEGDTCFGDTDLSYRSRSPIEFSESYEENVLFDNAERSYERRSISPIIVHRRFDRSEYQKSSERSFGRRSRSPVIVRAGSLERDYFHESRKSSFPRSRSPIKKRRSLGRESDSIKDSISLVKTISSIERTKNHRRKGSLDECVKRKSPFQERDRKNSIENDSLSSIKQQILYEKQKMQILKHKKKCHEKRSESSIERFLDDCKRSVERKLGSPTTDRSSDHGKKRFVNEKNKQSRERSISPFQRPRKFEGLERITVQRGRSFERTPSSVERLSSVSPTNCDSNQKISNCLIYDSGGHEKRTSSSRSRSSRQSERNKHNSSSAKGPFDIKSRDSDDHEKCVFKGKDMHASESKDFCEKVPPLVLIPGIFEKRETTSQIRLELSPISQAESLNEKEFNQDSKGFENRLDLSPVSETKSLKSDFEEDNKKLQEDNLGLSPVSQAGSFDDNEFLQHCEQSLEDKLQLSPISQPGSFERRVFCTVGDMVQDRMDLSPISQCGSFEEREFSHLQNEQAQVSGLSPISQAGSFEKLQDFVDVNDKCSNTLQPKNTDSMQEFLAELESSADGSRSSSVIFIPLTSECREGIDPSTKQYNRHKSLKAINDNIHGGYRKVYISDNEEMKSSDTNIPIEKPSSFGQVPFYKLPADDIGTILEKPTPLTDENSLKYDSKKDNKYPATQQYTQSNQSTKKDLLDAYQNVYDSFKQSSVTGKDAQYLKRLEPSSVELGRFHNQEEFTNTRNSFQDRNLTIDVFKKPRQQSFVNQGTSNLNINANTSLNKDSGRTYQQHHSVPNLDRRLYERSENNHLTTSFLQAPQNSSQSFKVSEDQNYISSLHNTSERQGQPFNAPFSKGYEAPTQKAQFYQPSERSNINPPSYHCSERPNQIVNQDSRMANVQSNSEAISVQKPYFHYPDNSFQRSQFQTDCSGSKFSLGPSTQFSSRPSDSKSCYGVSGNLSENSLFTQNKPIQYPQPSVLPKINFAFNLDRINPKIPLYRDQQHNVGQKPPFQQNLGRLNQNISYHKVPDRLEKELFDQFKPLHAFNDTANNQTPFNQNEMLNPNSDRALFKSTSYGPEMGNPNALYDQFSSVPGRNPLHHQLIGRNNINPQRQQISEQQNESSSFQITEKFKENLFQTGSEGPHKNMPSSERFQTSNQQEPSYGRSEIQNKTVLFDNQPERPNQYSNVQHSQGFKRFDAYMTSPLNPEDLNRSVQFNNVTASEPSSSNHNISQWEFTKANQPNQASKSHPYSVGSQKPDNPDIPYIDFKNYLGKIFGPNYLSGLRPNTRQIPPSENEGSSKLGTGNDTIFSSASDVVNPDPAFIGRYRNIPPSPEVLGKMLEGFVILFDVKSNSELEKDPFVVIQDSFSKSDRFGNLSLEETPEFQFPLPEPKHVCVLRWQGVMLAKADGQSVEEARHNAAIALINALAHTCYTVQAKYSYYCGGKLPLFMARDKEKLGVYKLVLRDEIIKSVTDTLRILKAQGYYTGRGVDATHIRVVFQIIEEFFKNRDTFCELLFGGKGSMDYTLGELVDISKHVQSIPWLQWRKLSGFGRGSYTAVSCKHTPQRICSHLLSNGGDDLRYRLIPPQGPVIELLTHDVQYSPNIIKSISQKPEANPVQHRADQSGDFKRSRPPQAMIGAGRGQKRGKWS